jgi:Ca2+-binding RTX toxin-like protein
VVADLTTPGNNTGDAVGDFYVGIEQLDGSNFNDTLSGTVGDDILEGWGGADRLVGLAGNDIYFVDDINDVVVETAGEGTADHVAVHQGSNYTLTAGADIELLTTANSGGTTSMNLIGNEIAQTIVGNNGSNLLGDGGGAGADVLRGSGGDDSYSIYNSDTDVIESNAGGGTDRIYAGRNYVLDDGVFVEEMSTTSRNATYSRNIEGNTSSQTIVGNEGKNVLGDGGGASSNGDVLIGGGGNDLYVVRNAGTTVIEAIGEGTFDRVSTSKDFTLTAGSEIESINTTSKLGTSNLRLTGNELAQTIQGNGGANWIDGGGGNDILLGEGGADTFVFSTALGAGNVDTIADFTSGEDMIFLDPAIFGLLPLGAFASNASGVAGTADIRIIYNSTSGGLFYDADGDGAEEAVKFAELQDSLTLTGADFFGGIPI